MTYESPVLEIYLKHFLEFMKHVFHSRTGFLEQYF